MHINTSESQGPPQTRIMHLQKQRDTRPTRIFFLLQRIHQEAQPRLSRSQTEAQVRRLSRGQACLEVCLVLNGFEMFRK